MIRNVSRHRAPCNAPIFDHNPFLMTSVSESRMPGVLRSPAALVVTATLALSGVAGASYLAGRATPRTEAEAAPTAAVIEAEKPTSKPDNAPAAACTGCGVVESVVAVQRKGEGTGVGAVAGGVVGGVLGNQVGAGQGRTAMTVLGAIGGGFAGNEVEKRARAVTVYRVRVRTDQGELRTIEQASTLAVGQRVRIDGHKLRPITADAAKG